MQTVLRVAFAVILGLILAVFGFLITLAGYNTLREWPAISLLHALCGVVWILAGPLMLAGSMWILGSLGRHRIPLWGTGAAAIVAGTVLIAGVLTHIVPCSGPS